MAKVQIDAIAGYDRCGAGMTVLAVDLWRTSWLGEYLGTREQLARLHIHDQQGQFALSGIERKPSSIDAFVLHDRAGPTFTRQLAAPTNVFCGGPTHWQVIHLSDSITLATTKL